MSDTAALLTQLDWIVATEPPSAGVVAIFFGIFTSTDVAKREFPQLYLMGSTSYDAQDEDWASQADDSWLPSSRYFKLPGLESMDPKEFEWVEQTVADLLEEIQADIVRLLATPEGRPVAVGWDGGSVRTLYVAKK